MSDIDKNAAVIEARAQVFERIAEAIRKSTCFGGQKLGQAFWAVMGAIDPKDLETARIILNSNNQQLLR